jgi:ferritin-like protein
MTTGYHESGLSEEAKDLHRGFSSLIEEIEAADWYHQRIDVSRDDTLTSILAHNRDEELEHAAMILEWLRRRMPELDEKLRLYLFTSGSIEDMEEAGISGQGGETSVEAHDLGIHGIK